MFFLDTSRQTIAEGIKEIALALEIILPSLAVDGHQIDIGIEISSPSPLKLDALGT